MLELLVAGLAVFFVWEFVVTLLPASLPPVVHPVLVAAVAYGVVRLPDDLTLVGALAGLVGLLHAVVRRLGAEPEPFQLRLPRSRTAHRRIPQIP